MKVIVIHHHSFFLISITTHLITCFFEIIILTLKYLFGPEIIYVGWGVLIAAKQLFVL
jgi:hypothetical protein